MTLWQGSDTASANRKDAKVLCLCGSDRFRDAFEAASHWLTLEGHVVIAIANAGPDAQTEGGGIGDLERKKLELCDEIAVLNVQGYIDEATRRQIVHAQRAGKAVSFLEPTDWDAPARGVRRAPHEQQPFLPSDQDRAVEEGTVLDLTAPFTVTRGAVLLYGPDETRPAFTLVSGHVWPGVYWVPEVWYAEAASMTSVRAFDAQDAVLQPLGELIRWAVATSGQISERMLWALFVVGSVATQDELSAIIGCRRESVTSAMRALRDQALVEKADGRIRLTQKGVVCASQLCALGGDAFDETDLNLPDDQLGPNQSEPLETEFTSENPEESDDFDLGDPARRAEERRAGLGRSGRA